MSSLEAKPDSYIRIAESRYGMSRALTTNPARSCEWIVVLPSVCSANDVALSSVSFEVMIERTTSTSGSTGTGLKKCRPITRPGLGRLGAELHDRHRRGVRGEELRVRQRRIELPEDVALQVLVLDHSLDRGVRALEVRQRGRVGEPRCGRLALRGLQLSGPDGTVERACDGRLGARDARVVGLDHGHVDARSRADLRDPEPIRPPPTTPTRIAMTLSSDQCASRPRSSSTRSSRRRWPAGRPRRRSQRPCPRPAGLGFLAAGYRSADAVRAEIGELRRLTDRPFGMNLFAPGPALADARRDRGLRVDAHRRGGALRRRARRAASRRRRLGREAGPGRRRAHAGRVRDLRLPVPRRGRTRCTRPAARCGSR